MDQYTPEALSGYIIRIIKYRKKTAEPTEENVKKQSFTEIPSTSKCTSSNEKGFNNTESFNRSMDNSKTNIPKQIGEKIKTTLQRHSSDIAVNFFKKWKETWAQKRISDKIDKELKKDNKRPYTILLFGDEESGKSTIINQMRILYHDVFGEEEKNKIMKNIRKNVRDAILAILTAMSELTPPVPLETLENQARIGYLQNFEPKSDFDYPPELYEHVEMLWRDKGVQATFDRANEYHLTDCAKYFLDKINTIKQIDYVPTNEDILHCHVIHTYGFYDIRFKFETFCENQSIQVHNFCMLEVVDQKDKPRMWKYFTSDLSALIFVAACNSYDLLLSKDPTDNRLKRSIELFKEVHNYRWSFNIAIPIIIFLNKQDLLSRKILDGNSKLEDYFPDFFTYQTPEYLVSQSGEPPEVVRAKYFIQKKFLQVPTWKEGSDAICYYHFTSAIATQNVQNAFNDCSYIIYRSYTCYRPLALL